MSLEESGERSGAEISDEPAAISSEKIVERIQHLGAVSRFLRLHLREDYARYVEEEIASHTLDIVTRGDEHLLPNADNTVHIPGGKEIYPGIR